MDRPTIAGDRLYGVSLRPQELDLYRERAQIALRYRPIFDDPDELTTSHFKLLVLEITVVLGPEDEVGLEGAGSLELAKCGWELELVSAAPCRVGSLPELEEELPLLLGRVADTINELARRAQLSAPPVGPERVQALLAEYRTRHASAS